MNLTHIGHALAAILLQCAVAVLCLQLGVDQPWWFGAAVAVCFFVGREYSQAEAKVHRKTGIMVSRMMPWHVLRVEYWSRDAILDLLFPIAACLVVIVNLP